MHVHVQDEKDLSLVVRYGRPRRPTGAGAENEDDQEVLHLRLVYALEGGKSCRADEREAPAKICAAASRRRVLQLWRL